MSKSNYKTIKEVYVKWILEECNTPIDEIEHLIDNLPEDKANELLSTFQEDMEKAGKSLPSSLYNI